VHRRETSNALKIPQKIRHKNPRVSKNNYRMCEAEMTDCYSCSSSIKKWWYNKMQLNRCTATHTPGKIYEISRTSPRYLYQEYIRVDECP